MEKLTEKQKRFCDEYIRTGNATQSYFAAYPTAKSEGTAAANAVRLLKNAKVKEYVEKRNREVSNSRIAGIQEVKEYWTSVMRGEEEKTQDRLKASEFLAKTLGAFLERQEASSGILSKLIEGLKE